MDIEVLLEAESGLPRLPVTAGHRMA